MEAKNPSVKKFDFEVIIPMGLLFLLMGGMLVSLGMTIWNAPLYRAQRVERAKKVGLAVQYALKNFESIDDDRDELLSVAELSAAAKRLPTTAEEYMVLLSAEIKNIGHITKANTSIGPVVYVNRNGGAGIGAGQTTNLKYGIDKRDLRHYTPPAD